MSTENEVRQEILQQLKRVTKENSPAIHAKLQTKNGYTYIERLVIERCVSSHMSIDQVIPQLEQEFNDL